MIVLIFDHCTAVGLGRWSILLMSLIVGRRMPHWLPPFFIFIRLIYHELKIFLRNHGITVRIPQETPEE